MKKQPSKSNQAEARRQQRIKAARKPAHTEVFEGYGVLVDGTRLVCGTQTQLPCFTIGKDTALFTAGIENCVGKGTARVVKLRAEFKVI